MIAALILALAASVTGIVHDSSGGVVSGAAVTIRVGSSELRATTGPDGKFAVDTPAGGDITIIVRAGGFAEKIQSARASDGLIDITVEPATLFETVTVTPTRTEQRLGDIPASVSVVTSEAFQSSPALIADDVLRQVPSFSLFRRTSSLVAQPTAQGVSLRGIGPSGQSRTLVLLDGIPFNDPFGGWVYWTRVPMASVDRVEITEDSSSSLYGNIAMGGVINIITAHPTRRTLELNPQYGNHQSPKFDFFGSDQWNKVAAAVEGSFLHTDGFPIVAPIERGPIDNNANVEYQNITGKLEFNPSDRFQGFARAGYFSENRNNAKIGELNDTRWTTVNGGIRARLKDDSDLQARVFVDAQRAHFNFLAVTNPAAHAQHRPARHRPERADQRRRRHGAVVEGVRQPQRVQRRLRLAVGRRREPGSGLRRVGADGHHAVPGRLPARPGVRDPGSDPVGAAVLRRHPAESAACSRRTSSRRPTSWC